MMSDVVTNTVPELVSAAGVVPLIDSGLSTAETVTATAATAAAAWLIRTLFSWLRKKLLKK